MLEFFGKLLDTSDFPPRWHCGLWTEGHGWLHIVSDIATFAAYFAVPCVVAYYVARRPDLKVPRVFWIFLAAAGASGGARSTSGTSRTAGATEKKLSSLKPKSPATRLLGNDSTLLR